jgi:1-acyl-sn-glycerol-3-phosphate acyltransferase
MPDHDTEPSPAGTEPSPAGATEPSPETGDTEPDGRTEVAEPAAMTRPPAVRAEAVDVHPPTWLERASYALVRGLFLGLAKLYFRLEIRGAENVPAHGPFVLAPVHRSNLDFILVATVRRPRMRYMGKSSIWKWKPLGKFVSMLGAFPVHRGTADRESLRTCMRVIENGEPLVMFPEGTRRSGPTIEEMFDGPAFVAARTGVPIVPVGIGGSSEAMPVGTKFIRPHKIVLVVGEPIVPPVGEGTGRVKRRVVRELTDQLQSDIQALYDEARRLSN